jgi:hypothetical protein
MLAVPLLPPQTRTLPLSCALVVVSKLAEWNFNADAIGPVVAVQVPALELGS